MKPDQNKNWLVFPVMDWRLLPLLIIGLFYFVLFRDWVGQGRFPLSYGTDYLAFWSLGKIANEQGYSHIYDLDLLLTTQTQELQSLGVIQAGDKISPIPAPILAIFVPPFQALSFLEADDSYWAWSFLNLVILVAYLSYFIHDSAAGQGKMANVTVFLALFLSYAIFDNFVQGQVQVFLLVCAGEFIRNARQGKPIQAGAWLGGLLLKPQVLILILPVLVFLHYWKQLFGFFISSGAVLVSSLALSGIPGLEALIRLWTQYSSGIATNSPERMINWRMVGANFNALTHTSFGWLLTGAGMLLTLLVIYLLVRKFPLPGTHRWILGMLAVFSATLAITWHSHFHMAMILIPFLAFSTLRNLMPFKMINFWTVITPFAWAIVAILGFLLVREGNTTLIKAQGLVIALSGFAVNLSLLACVIRSFIFHGTR